MNNEGWYTDAAEAETAVWSDIYPWDNKPDGTLVANSNETPISQLQGEQVIRLASIDSSDLVISATSDQLLQEFNALQNITSPQELIFSLQGKR